MEFYNAITLVFCEQLSACMLRMNVNFVDYLPLFYWAYILVIYVLVMSNIKCVWNTWSATESCVVYWNTKTTALCITDIPLLSSILTRLSFVVQSRQTVCCVLVYCTCSMLQADNAPFNLDTWSWLTYDSMTWCITICCPGHYEVMADKGFNVEASEAQIQHVQSHFTSMYK